MKIHQYLLHILGALMVMVYAADPDPSKFPQCAVSCWHQLSNCSLTDTACLCVDDSSQASLRNCALKNCTTKEYFITRRLNEQQCGITPRKGRPALDGSTLVPLILGSFFFLVRVIAKCNNLGGSWGADDYTITISYVLAVTEYTLNVYCIHYGFGQDIWNVPFDDLTQFFKYFDSLAIIYKIQISLAKISVCLFLLRIFQTRVFCYLAYTLIGINIAVGITWALTDGFRCIPVHLTWDGWTNEYPGKCIDFNAAILVNCLVNIIVDSIMVVVPIYEVSKLQLPLRKKAGVGLMFMMGSIIIIIAIIRVVVFWDNHLDNNETAGLHLLMHWSVIECLIAVICACLPASRALLVYIFPTLGSSTRRTYHSRLSNTYNRGQLAGNNQISKSVSYSVDYAAQAEMHDSSSIMQLVEMGGKHQQY